MNYYFSYRSPWSEQWLPASDSPRREDFYTLQVDSYFQLGPYFSVWGNYDPVAGFHRPLRDYWQAFSGG